MVLLIEVWYEMYFGLVLVMVLLNFGVVLVMVLLIEVWYETLVWS